MESDDDDVHELEAEQWNYLDGTPASRPDPIERPSGLVRDVPSHVFFCQFFLVSNK